MFGYYLELAFRNLKRNPGLTALMIGAVALGIAVCVMTLTMYRAMSGNPIWWKNDVLYAVTMDFWDPQEPAWDDKPELPPTQLTYRDAMAVYASDIPKRKVLMHKAVGILSVDGRQIKPERVTTRVTTKDFFAAFDVPFQYGGTWTDAADTGPEPVMVISRKLNDKLFGGGNSVGRRVRWNDNEFRIIGVREHWNPMPSFYDVNNGSLEEAEDVYIPFGWTVALELDSAGNTNGWKPEDIKTYDQFLNSEVIWIQMWVELPDAATRDRFQAFIDNYAQEQKRAGRYQRPLNNRLTQVDQWLKDQDVVGNDDRVLVGLAFAFLAVCLLNTVGLLLAKFLNHAPITGVRRALGASRRQIFLQHLVEVGVISSIGAVLGLALGGLLLLGLKALYTFDPTDGGGTQAIAHVDVGSVVTALALAFFATIAAGLYPAWRIGRIPPASYLKAQ
ncbi:MAG TPA: ABC transporter permease [Steroidobacteraceae bacterium]|nr:ABC transporter permease [Steroidobacteraceae bacterium]